MAEIGGITELQLLQAEIKILKKQLDGVHGGENTSVACDRIVSHITKAEDHDSFVMKEGGASEHNQFHNAGPSAEEGCCVVL
mmetsp:Transcript_2536/g.4332  ORF Transcript_2536/g.4332 Transcript_2536/m.4332 type:complete len:82 (+) Transcript_2536:1053-1298(+)